MVTTTTQPLAIVTGASSGIGYELAVQFAQHGFDLLIVAEDTGLAQAAEDLKALGTQVESIQCDLATLEGVEAFWEKVRMANRPVAVAALNAGIGVSGKFEETSLQEEIHLINLNIISTVHLAKRVVQEMIERSQGGRILFTASVAATMPGPYMAVYSASKAFVHSFAEALRYELKDKGITVTSLMPDATETNFFERAQMQNTKVAQQEKEDPAEVARQGFEALMAGKDHVIAGSMKVKLKNAANDVIPDRVKAGMYAKSVKPGSANG